MSEETVENANAQPNRHCQEIDHSQFVDAGVPEEWL